MNVEDKVRREGKETNAMVRITRAVIIGRPNRAFFTCLSIVRRPFIMARCIMWIWLAVVLRYFSNTVAAFGHRSSSANQETSQTDHSKEICETILHGWYLKRLEREVYRARGRGLFLIQKTHGEGTFLLHLLVSTPTCISACKMLVMIVTV